MSRNELVKALLKGEEARKIDTRKGARSMLLGLKGDLSDDNIDASGYSVRAANPDVSSSVPVEDVHVKNRRSHRRCR